MINYAETTLTPFNRNVGHIFLLQDENKYLRKIQCRCFTLFQVLFHTNITNVTEKSGLTHFLPTRLNLRIF